MPCALVPVRRSPGLHGHALPGTTPCLCCPPSDHSISITSMKGKDLVLDGISHMIWGHRCSWPAALLVHSNPVVQRKWL